MSDVVEGLLWLLMVPVTCLLTMALVLAAMWFGAKLRWRR